MTLTSFRPGLTASLLALAVFGAGPAAAYDDREIERPTGGGGIGIGIDLFGILKAIQNRDGAEAQPEAPPLAKAGPQMPALAGMGRWQIDAVLKGGWPVVVSYLAPAGTAFEVSFEVEGQPRCTASSRVTRAAGASCSSPCRTTSATQSGPDG